MPHFYVYAHRTLSPRDKGELFYIGKGRGQRAWSKDSRNSHWRNIVGKYGYTVDILMDGLSESHAFDLEKSLITVCGQSVLCNLTLGGGGISGLKHSPESRRKISDAGKGRLRSPESIAKSVAGLTGYKHSLETRAKLSAAHVGQTAWNKGKTLSDDHKAKLSAAHKGVKLPESTRANMKKNRVGMKGKRHSEETKAKISAAKRARNGMVT